MSVPNVASYRAMEPVASHWQEHHALGDSLISGLKGAGVKIFSNGKMEMDLTQTSFSTVPSIDIELGDKASDHSASTLDLSLIHISWAGQHRKYAKQYPGRAGGGNPAGGQGTGYHGGGDWKST